MELWLDQTVGRRLSPAQRSVLLQFRTELCPTPACVCLLAHSLAELRRFPFDLERRQLAYRPQLCERIDCDFSCRNCHGVTELSFHPLRYKTQPCSPACKRAAELCPYLHPGESFQLIERKEINMDRFKTMPCPQPAQSHHDKKVCFFYHGPQDRRRSHQDHVYGVQSCPEHCSREDCKFCHNKIEELFHPNKYKKRLCDQPKNCGFGGFCAFAHSQHQLRIKLIHREVDKSQFSSLYYKTEWCPFNHKAASTLCPYAHSFVDYRRSPREYKYSPKPCKMWSRNDQFACPRGNACQYSHGSFEVECHPDYMGSLKKGSARSTSEGGRDQRGDQAISSKSTKQSDGGKQGMQDKQASKIQILQQTMKAGKLVKTSLGKGGNPDWLYGDKKAIPSMFLGFEEN